MSGCWSWVVSCTNSALSFSCIITWYRIWYVAWISYIQSTDTELYQLTNRWYVECPFSWLSLTGHPLSGCRIGMHSLSYFTYILNFLQVLITFLHHTDPTIPHYKKTEWTFVRGATATIDRPFLGWVGRFFFHNICHDHITHRALQNCDHKSCPLTLDIFQIFYRLFSSRNRRQHL